MTSSNRLSLTIVYCLAWLYLSHFVPLAYTLQVLALVRSQPHTLISLKNCTGILKFTARLGRLHVIMGGTKGSWNYHWHMHIIMPRGTEDREIIMCMSSKLAL